MCQVALASRKEWLSSFLRKQQQEKVSDSIVCELHELINLQIEKLNINHKYYVENILFKCWLTVRKKQALIVLFSIIYGFSFSNNININLFVQNMRLIVLNKINYNAVD